MSLLKPFEEVEIGQCFIPARTTLRLALVCRKTNKHLCQSLNRIAEVELPIFNNQPVFIIEDIQAQLEFFDESNQLNQRYI